RRVTSAPTGSASPPASRIAATVARAPPSFRSTTATRAPSAASAWAIAWPIPLAAPVTIATRSVSRMSPARSPRDHRHAAHRQLHPYLAAHGDRAGDRRVDHEEVAQRGGHRVLHVAAQVGRLGHRAPD